MIVNLPGAVVVDHEKACLLGSPIGNVSSFDSAIEDKITHCVPWGIVFHTWLLMTL